MYIINAESLGNFFTTCDKCLVDYLTANEIYYIKKEKRKQGVLYIFVNSPRLKELVESDGVTLSHLALREG